MTITENDTATERIAKIRATFLGIEDHGIFTSVLDLDYGGSGQGAGTLCLDYNDRELGQRVESVPGAVHRWVLGCLRACGVDQWEKVVGRTVIAICEDGWNGKVIGLKPLPTERGRVFMFSEVSNQDRTPDVPDPAFVRCDDCAWDLCDQAKVCRKTTYPASEPEIEWVPVTVVNEHGEKVGPQGMWRPKEQAE